MIRVLLFLCSCAIAFAGNKSTNTSAPLSPTVTLLPSPAVNSTTHSHMIMSTSSLVSPVVNTSTVYTNRTVAPYTTSVMPMTSSPAPPPTTKPTPTPAPDHFGNYNVKRSPNGSFCLLAQMDVKIDVEYRTTRNGSNNTAMIHIPYPRDDPDVKVGGSCGDKTSNVVIMWNGTTFELKFERYNISKNSSNHTTEDWKVEELSLFINTAMDSKFKDPKDNVSVIFKSIGLKVPKGYNYKCDVETKYNQSGVTIHLTSLQLQPFDVENNSFSNSTRECDGDHSPTPSTKPKDNNIVPIAVGCALAGLVLIVLIAYIIGRRKSQRGYEKV